MPYYRVDFRHTQVGLRKLIEFRMPRLEQIERTMASVDGRVLHLFYAFGTTDGFALVEAPNDVSLAAAVLKVQEAGAVELSTTVLLTHEQFTEALEKTAEVEYEPPGPSAEAG